MKKIFIIISLFFLNNLLGYEKKSECYDARIAIKRAPYFQNTDGTYCYQYYQDDGSLKRCEVCVQLTDDDKKTIKDALLKKHDSAVPMSTIIDKLNPDSIVVRVGTDIDKKIIIEQGNPTGATVDDVLSIVAPHEVHPHRQRFSR